MLNNFFNNPDKTMREFLKISLEADKKTKKRAKLLIYNDLYNLNK